MRSCGGFQTSTGSGCVEKALLGVVVVVSEIGRAQVLPHSKDERVLHYRKLPIRKKSEMISGKNVLSFLFVYLF